MTKRYASHSLLFTFIKIARVPGFTKLSLPGPRAIGCMVMRLHGGTKAREITVYTDGISLRF
jgi:hypothetical protein